MTHCEFFDDNNYDAMALGMVRGVSEDNFLASFFCPRQQYQEPIAVAFIEPLIVEQPIEVPNFINYKRPNVEKRIKGTNQRKDYKKNICGYITKKIVRQFMSQIYKQKVLDLCQKYGCDYDELVKYYDKKIERITGPTHLDMLLNANKQDSQMKKCFKEFFIWFLRHRYLRYLLSQGKMDKKQVYVDYKNKTLLYLGSMQEEIQYNSSNYGESESKQTVSIYSLTQMN